MGSERGVVYMATMTIAKVTAVLSKVCIFVLFGAPSDDAKDGYIRDAHANLLPLPAMRFIPGGEFVMGSPISDPDAIDYHRDEQPKGLIKVRSFFLAQFPVTVEEFCVFLSEQGNGERKQPQHVDFENGRFWPTGYQDRLPAVQVNWVDAEAYCKWLSEKTRMKFRRPTEAEWEYAVRGAELRDWP